MVQDFKTPMLLLKLPKCRRFRHGVLVFRIEVVKTNMLGTAFLYKNILVEIATDVLALVPLYRRLLSFRKLR